MEAPLEPGTITRDLRTYLRRQIDRHEAEGMEGLLDKRSTLTNGRQFGVMRLTDLYRTAYSGWNTQLFHTYVRDPRRRWTGCVCASVTA